MAQYIFAARVYLDSVPTVSNASDIGLYAVSGSNSEMRWIEVDISSYSPTLTWKAGVLIPNPFGKISQSVNLLYGGDLPTIGGTDISIANTLSIGGAFTQLDYTLESNDIWLQNLRCDIVRFEISSGSLTNADGDIVFRGTIGKPDTTEKIYKLPVETSLLKRKANLATVITTENYPNADGDILGQSVPVTFGEFKPEFDTNDNVLYNGYAKFKRTANKEENFKVGYVWETGESAGGATLEMWSQGNVANVQRVDFPVVGNDGESPTKVFYITFDEDMAWFRSTGGGELTTGTYTLTSLIGKYVYVTEALEDASSSQGSYRQIENAQIKLDVSTQQIIITAADYFKEPLQGNATATDANQCWIRIINIDRNYTADVWRCRNFLDESGVAITKGLNLYSYSSERKAKVTSENTDAVVEEKPLEYYRLPSYAYKDSQNGNKNELDIEIKLFDTTPDQMNSFLVLPVRELKLSTDTPSVLTSKWGFTNVTKKIADGVYSFLGKGGVSVNSTSGSIDNVTNQNHTSKLAYTILHSGEGGGAGWESAFILSYRLPFAPKKFDYDNMYMGVNCYISAKQSVDSGAGCSVWWRRFLGSKTEAKNVNFSFMKEGRTNNILDEYYTTNPTTGNIGHYSNGSFAVVGVGGSSYNYYGYYNIPLSGIGKENYNSVEENLLYLSASNSEAATKAAVYEVTELSIIYQKSVPIKKEIYSPFQGRVYNGKWGQAAGSSSSSSSSSSQSSPSDSSSSSSSSQSTPSSSSSSSSSQSSPSSSSFSSSSQSSSSFSCALGVGRKNACAMINNPIDILEHTMRLQDWSEQGEVKNWGKEYANVPLIDVSASEGGYDYEDLGSIKGLRPSRQILNYSKAYTDEIARSLAKEFFIVPYQNPATGKESVSYIADKSNTDPSTTITLASIVGPIGEVVFPDMKGIYCEPIIRYAKNNASGGYDKEIQITNTSKAVYDSSYVSGLTGSTAELIWTQCKKLREVTRQVEKMPTSLSNKDWIVSDSDAIWYLSTLISWMGAKNSNGTPSGVTYDPKKRIVFSVPYEVGKDWFITKHLKLQLPHQTNDTAIECLIEDIAINIERGRELVTVKIVLYGSAADIAIYVQDTYNNGVLLADWQDTYNLQAVHGEGADIQDIT